MSLQRGRKIRVLVLYGGRSGESEVSQRSAAAVIKHLDHDQFEAIPIAIDSHGRWLKNNLEQLTFDDSLPIATEASQFITAQDLVSGPDDSFCGVVFSLLHGSLGEDGSMQGFLDVLGVPYTGSGVLGSSIGMDKDVSKRLAQVEGVPVVPFLALDAGRWQRLQSVCIKRIEEQISYPLFVKPSSTGSSLGITKVKRSADLLAAVNLAFEYDLKILVERALTVREIEVSVLENPQYGEAPLVSVPGEIACDHEFYSYEAKYLHERGVQFYVPASLRAEQVDWIHKAAIRLFGSLSCQGMARIDFFIDKCTQEIYFNELNTIPGFTKISMYPKLWEASGMSYSALLTHLIDLARQRHQRVTALRNFRPERIGQNTLG